MSVHPQTLTILFLSASLANEARLRLQEKVHEIEVGLQRTKHRNQIALEQRWAFSPTDWRAALLEVRPQIVHFLGYGSVDEQLADSEALTRLFEVFSDQVECVVLQGCYSRREAKAFAQYIKYVIDLSREISNRAALEFAIGFYDALGAAKSVEDAYKFGCNAQRTASIPEYLVPELLTKQYISSPSPSLSELTEPTLPVPPSLPPIPSSLDVQSQAKNQKRRLGVKERPPLEEMTLRQLRKVASYCNISRYSRMRKLQLLAAVEKAMETNAQLSSQIQEEQQVEAAKFELSQDYQLGGSLSCCDEGLGDLPGGYGESRIVLMPRDPQWAYAYWDVPNEHKEYLRRQGGEQLAIRLYDVTDIMLEYQSPHNVQEYLCDEMMREYYVSVPASDRDYVADIGYRCADGRWLVLARSSGVRIPLVYPSDWIEYLFLTVHGTFEYQGNETDFSSPVDWIQNMENETYAIAQIKDHQSGQPFYLSQIYELQAGIRSSIPAGFKGVPVELPHQEKPIQLEIVVSAEDIEIEPNWLQPYIINRSEESPFVEFKLKPKTSGYKQICVEFLYQRHWLAKIQFEVKVVEVKELVTA